MTIPLGTLGGALICTVLLLPVLRLRGVYFAIVTLTFPLLLTRFIETTKILGGTEGMSALSPLPNLWVELYLPVIALLICLFGFRRLINEDYGLVLQGIRDNDRAVMSGAINIYWFKIQAVFLAGLVGAFSGAFMTHLLPIRWDACLFIGLFDPASDGCRSRRGGNLCGSDPGGLYSHPPFRSPPRLRDIAGRLLFRDSHHLHCWAYPRVSFTISRESITSSKEWSMSDKMEDKTILKVENVSKNFGGVAAIVHVSFHLREGRASRGDRPERIRKDHAGQSPHRLCATRFRESDLPGNGYYGQDAL